MTEDRATEENIPIDFYTDNRIMNWNIDASRIRKWYGTLDAATRESVAAALKLLSEQGPNLKRPFVGEVQSSRFHNMKELRPASQGRTEVRILFAFDPLRNAILLLAGDKWGRWRKWYQRAVPKADRLYQEHLDSLKKEAF